MDPRRRASVRGDRHAPAAGEAMPRAPAAGQRARPPGSPRRAAGLTVPGQVPRLRGERPPRGRPRRARVDPDRPLAGRRRALRRRDGVAPPRADRQPGRRRAGARRPLAQRRLRQRPPGGVEPADRRRRDRRRPPHAVVPGHRVAQPAVGARSPRSPPSSRPRSPGARYRGAPHGRDDRGPVAQGRHGQDHHGAHAGRRAAARSGSTCSPSTSTRRATCRTTSTSRRTRRPTVADVLRGDAKAQGRRARRDRPRVADPRRGRALAVGQDGPRARAAQGAQGRAQAARRDPDRLPAGARPADHQRPRRRRLGADLLRGAVLRAAGRRGRARGHRAGQGVLQPRPRVARRRAQHRRHAHGALARGLRRAQGALRRQGLRHRHPLLDRLRGVGRAGPSRSSTTGPTSARTTWRWRTRCWTAIGLRDARRRSSKPLLRELEAGMRRCAGRALRGRARGAAGGLRRRGDRARRTPHAAAALRRRAGARDAARARRAAALADRARLRGATPLRASPGGRAWSRDAARRRVRLADACSAVVAPARRLAARARAPSGRTGAPGWIPAAAAARSARPTLDPRRPLAPRGSSCAAADASCGASPSRSAARTTPTPPGRFAVTDKLLTARPTRPTAAARSR